MHLHYICSIMLRIPTQPSPELRIGSWLHISSSWTGPSRRTQVASLLGTTSTQMCSAGSNVGLGHSLPLLRNSGSRTTKLTQKHRLVFAVRCVYTTYGVRTYNVSASHQFGTPAQNSQVLHLEIMGGCWSHIKSHRSHIHTMPLSGRLRGMCPTRTYIHGDFAKQGHRHERVPLGNRPCLQICPVNKHISVSP